MAGAAADGVSAPDSAIRMSEAAWRRRFRAARTTLPGWARDDPERLIYASNTGGKWELYAWDRRTVPGWRSRGLLWCSAHRPRRETRSTWCVTANPRNCSTPTARARG